MRNSGKLLAKGRFLSTWGTEKDEPGGFGGYFTGFKNIKPKSLVGPIALCFDEGGHLWVSCVSGRVQRFTQDGEYLSGLVDVQGTKAGQFYAPHGIAFDRTGCLYVVDSFNHRVQTFSVSP